MVNGVFPFPERIYWELLCRNSDVYYQFQDTLLSTINSSNKPYSIFKREEKGQYWGHRAEGMACSRPVCYILKKKKKIYLVCYIIILNFDDYPKRSKVYTFTLLSSLCIFIIQSFILVNYINFVSCIHIYVGMSLLLTINNSIYIYIYISLKNKNKNKK